MRPNLIPLKTGTRRSRYPHLPPAAVPELLRLKREYGFVDLPAEPGPGGLALVRASRARGVNGLTVDVIAVTETADVLLLSHSFRFERLQRPAASVPQKAKRPPQPPAASAPRKAKRPRRHA